MTRFQFNRLRADKATLDHLDKNAGTYATAPAIVLSIIILRDKIVGVEEALRIQMTSLKGNRRNRGRYKTKLAVTALYVCAGLFAYGKEKGNDSLVEISRVTESAFKKMGELDMVGLCTAILAEARGIEFDLIPHGVEPPDLDVFEFEIGTYRGLLDDGRTDVVKRKTARISMPALQADISEHFTMRLDKQVKRLREDHPSLVQEYFTARRILNYGIRHEVPVEPADLTMAVPDGKGGD